MATTKMETLLNKCAQQLNISTPLRSGIDVATMRPCMGGAKMCTGMGGAKMRSGMSGATMRSGICGA